MNRRKFIRTTAAASIALGLGSWKNPGKTHYLSLSFDDGFKKSFYRTAEIHEEYGLKACLNVIATGHLPTFNTEPKWIPQHLLGNFDDWNAFKQKGHEVMPHTWEHLNLTEIPFEKATSNLDKCFDYFEKNLEGYDASKAMYNFAYNASTTELEDYALKRVRAVRTGGWLVLGDTMINLVNTSTAPEHLGCWSHGPDFCNNYVETEINKFLKGDGGWLILNCHGLDNEGWGPMSTSFLDKLLKRLSRIQSLSVLPTGMVLNEVYG